MNKIVLITGASSGIGYETAKMFVKQNDIVINISREISQVCQYNFKADISNEEQLNEIFKQIKEKFGKIDILINNAGYGMSGITELLKSSECKAIFDVNFFGTLNCIKKALPLMKKGGKIINIASAMALFPIPFRALYGASKSAVTSLSYSLRMELAPLGIDVTTICPGNVKSNFTKNRIKNFETSQRYGRRIENATEKIDKNDDKRMLANCVAKHIFNQAKKKKSKPMTIVGGKYKLLYFLTRITPKSWLLNLTEKIYGGKF